MPPTPDAVARQWFREVWDEGKEETIDRLMAPDAIVHGLTGPGGPPMVGPAAFKPIFHTFREALGDLAIDIERVFVDGEYCTVHCRVKGGVRKLPRQRHYPQPILLGAIALEAQIVIAVGPDLPAVAELRRVKPAGPAGVPGQTTKTAACAG